MLSRSFMFQSQSILCNYKSQNTGFCGQSICIKVVNNSKDTLFVCGHFSCYSNTDDINIGSIVHVSYFDDNDQKEAPFYFGKSNVFNKFI